MLGEPCGDFSASAVTGSCAAVALCDAAGGFQGSDASARILSSLVARALAENFDNCYSMTPNQAKCFWENVIEKPLLSYGSKHSIPAKNLASTIVAAAMDEKQRCICLHLGDGIILSQKEGSLQFDIVSSPMNGLLSRSTYLTMNCPLSQYLRIYRWRNETSCNLLLLTDGAASCLLPQGLPIHHRTELLCGSSPQEIREFLSNNHPSDDAGFALISPNKIGVDISRC